VEGSFRLCLLCRLRFFFVQVECLEERIKQLEGYETGALIRRYDKELQHMRTAFQSDQARLQATIRDVQRALSEAKREGADWETKCAELERRWSEENGADVNRAGVMFEEDGRGKNDAKEWLAGEGCENRKRGTGVEELAAESEGLRRESEGLRREIEGLREENKALRQENEGLREGSGAELRVKETVLQSVGESERELVAARMRIEELQNLLGVFEKEKEEFQKQLASARGEQGEGARLKAEADTWKEKSAALERQMDDEKMGALWRKEGESPREELDGPIETRLSHGRVERFGLREGGSGEESERSMLLGAAQEEIEKLQEVRI
jgi:myosin heavy subunit